jgi:putative DNA primase/helicase
MSDGQMPDDQIVRLEQVRKQKTQPQAASNVPIITVVSGKRHQAADEGLAAVHAAGVAFYRRDRGLVRVCLIKAKNTDGEIILVPGIMPVTPAMLCRALGQSACWQKVNSLNKLVQMDPPDKIVEQITGMVDEWPFPPLAGVITCPTLRPDGSLLAHEGYDLATGLVLYKTIPIPPIPEFPTRDDADAAILRLTDLLAEFPFASDASKSVALSLLMTPVLRGAFPVTPMHLTNAPEAGTGKSYLADITSAIATGERCAVISVAPNPEETEKRLIGAALAGYPIIALDNLRELLQGDFLCQVTERPLLQLRRLGSSDQIRVANTFTPLANGNNATVADDLVRRTISCILDANMESPEKRTFTTNPLAMVMRNRGLYIAAILTIARAYIADGKPDRATPLPSYEGWSDLVRSSLIWLGYPDPVETMETTRGADPVRQDRASVFTAWHAELGPNEQYLAAELADLADRRNEPIGTPVRPQLRAAFLAIAVQRGTGGTKIDTRRLGIWLMKNENTIAKDLKLTVDRSDYQRPRWSILRLSKTMEMRE